MKYGSCRFGFLGGVFIGGAGGCAALNGFLGGIFIVGAGDRAALDGRFDSCSICVPKIELRSFLNGLAMVLNYFDYSRCYF